MKPKSIGRDTTFEKDADDGAQIFQVWDELAKEVHADVIADGFKFGIIIVRVSTRTSWEERSTFNDNEPIWIFSQTTN